MRKFGDDFGAALSTFEIKCIEMGSKKYSKQ